MAAHSHCHSPASSAATILDAVSLVVPPPHSLCYCRRWSMLILTFYLPNDSYPYEIHPLGCRFVCKNHHKYTEYQISRGLQHSSTIFDRILLLSFAGATLFHFGQQQQQQPKTPSLVCVCVRFCVCIVVSLLSITFRPCN